MVLSKITSASKLAMVVLVSVSTASHNNKGIKTIRYHKDIGNGITGTTIKLGILSPEEVAQARKNLRHHSSESNTDMPKRAEGEPISTPGADIEPARPRGLVRTPPPNPFELQQKAAEDALKEKRIREKQERKKMLKLRKKDEHELMAIEAYQKQCVNLQLDWDWVNSVYMQARKQLSFNSCDVYVKTVNWCWNQAQQQQQNSQARYSQAPQQQYNGECYQGNLLPGNLLPVCMPGNVLDSSGNSTESDSLVVTVDVCTPQPVTQPIYTQQPVTQPIYTQQPQPPKDEILFGVFNKDDLTYTLPSFNFTAMKFKEGSSNTKKLTKLRFDWSKHAHGLELLYLCWVGGKKRVAVERITEIDDQKMHMKILTEKGTYSLENMDMEVLQKFKKCFYGRRHGPTGTEHYTGDYIGALDRRRLASTPITRLLAEMERSQ